MNQEKTTRIEQDILMLAPDIFGASFMMNPYPVYEELLQYKVAKIPMGTANTWVFSGYDDVLFLLRDGRLSNKRSHLVLRNFTSEQADQIKQLSGILSKWIIYLDAEEHKKLRKFLNKGISAYLSKRTEKFVEKTVDELIDRLKNKSEVDIVSEFSQRLPGMVMISVLGIPLSDYDRFVVWAEHVGSFVGTFRPAFEQALEAQQALIEMDDYFAELVGQKEKKREDDLVSYMLEVNKEENILTDSELRTLIINLIFAGYETTGHLITSGIHAFLTHPEQKQKLMDNPGLMSNATEELLRYESAAQLLGRLVTEDFEIHNQLIRKGDLVIVLLGAANNDPSKFSNPRSFNIEREFKYRPLSFGAGFHACPGSGLTIIEVKHVFNKLFEQLPGLHLLDKEVEWRTMNPAFRGLRHLRVGLY